jgi:hypothetical protein
MVQQLLPSMQQKHFLINSTTSDLEVTVLLIKSSTILLYYSSVPGSLPGRPRITNNHSSFNQSSKAHHHHHLQ